MIDDLPCPVAPTIAISSASAKATVTGSRNGPKPCMTSSTGRISRDRSRRLRRLEVGIEELVEQRDDARVARLPGEIEIRREQVARREPEPGADDVRLRAGP